MLNPSRALRLFLSVLLLVLFQSPAFADPPGRVGRVSFLSGTVSFYSDADEGWREALLNYPVTSENSLWTERDARAEVRIGSTALRLDEDSVLDFQRINDDDTLAYLQRGALNLRIRDLDKRDVYRVITPEGQVTLRARGRYRIDTDAGRSRITVFEGRARVDAQGAALTIEGGKTLVLRGGNEAPSMTFEATEYSAFDNWANARDERLERRTTSRYVPPTMTGYEELDEYGEWSEVAEYGTVWYPRQVERNWVPYRYGHWSWVRPWGWTWGDNAAWGFAPFHYGRWVYTGHRWGWWPGSYIARPIYAPALVAWIGQPGWNVTFSGGNGSGIGWFPLAPYEPFLPVYTSNITYIRNINHHHRPGGRPIALVAPPVYANHKPGATVVSRTTFSASVPVAANMARVSGEAVAAQPVSQASAFAPHFTPQRSALAPGAAATLAMPKPNLALPTINQRGAQAAPPARQNGASIFAEPKPLYQTAPTSASGAPLAPPKPGVTAPVSARNNETRAPRISGQTQSAPQPVRAAPAPQLAPGNSIPARQTYEVRPSASGGAARVDNRGAHDRPGRVEAVPQAAPKPLAKPVEPQPRNGEKNKEGKLKGEG